MSLHLLNALLGATLVTGSTQLFQYMHGHPLNLAELFWTMTTMRPKWLLDYLPFVAGVFFIAGVVFDWMAYEGVGIMVPYGPEPDILHRTSMYGFALGGLLMGFGGQLSGGDLIYHTCGQPSKGKWFSLILTLLILSSAVIASSLCNSDYLPILTNQEINPIMQSFHLLSANMSIVIATVLTIVSSCTLYGELHDKWKVAQKIGGSLTAGALLGMGFLVCGLSIRGRLFQGLTPGSDWQWFVLVFIGLLVLGHVIIHHASNQLCHSVQNSQVFPICSQLEVKEPLISNYKQSLGAILMGLGWGISGLEFTGYFIHSAIFTIPTVIVYGAFLIFGSMICDIL